MIMRDSNRDTRLWLQNGLRNHYFPLHVHVLNLGGHGKFIGGKLNLRNRHPEAPTAKPRRGRRPEA